MITAPDLSLPLLETAVRATLVLVGAAAIAVVLRRGSGTARHALWTATTGALLALPLLHGVLPTIPVPWFPGTAAAAVPASVPRETPMPVLADDAVAAIGSVELGTASEVGVTEWAAPPIAAKVVEVAERPSVGVMLTLAWLFGVFAVGLPLALGHWRARRLVRGAVPCHDGRLLVRFVAAAHTVGLRESVTLLLSDDVRTPMTGGLLHPVVLLPAKAIGWSDECLDAVLRHELVHVRRRDALRQLAARLSVALYWFHPLAWRAASLGALAREQACDEAVLSHGTRPSRYARHLLELADPSATPIAVPALVRLDHPHLEERVMAILRAAPTPASRRQTLFTILTVAAWTLCVAAIGPATAQQPPAAPIPPAAPVVPAASAVPSVAPVPAAPAAPRPMVLGAPAAPEPAPAAPAAPAQLGALTPPPAPPDAPVPPAPPVAPTGPDCEQVGSGYRTGGSDRTVPVRMHTSVIDGVRVCVAIRGKVDEAAGFVPRGRLPAGVVMTLASSGPRGSQRLVITGTASGNSHTWSVNDQERPFDAAAASWRDAMLDVVQLNMEKSKIRSDEARARGGVARARAEEARMEAEIARIRSQQAGVEAQAMAARVAPRVDRGQEARVASAARIAELEAQRQRTDANTQARLAARQAELQSRRAQLDARVATGDVEPRLAEGARRDLQAAEEAMVRDQQRMTRDAEALREREMRQVQRSLEQAEQSQVRARELREREMQARLQSAERDADARIRAVEERRSAAAVARQARTAEQEAVSRRVEERIAEVDTRMAPLMERLNRAIERITPR